MSIFWRPSLGSGFAIGKKNIAGRSYHKEVRILENMNILPQMAGTDLKDALKKISFWDIIKY
jgi:hypothetical protein